MAGFNQFGDPPWLNPSAGFQGDFGLYAPGGSRVIGLCNGTRTGDDPTFTSKGLFTTSATLLQACSYLRAGMSDTILVFPGHSESVTDATMLGSLVAGSRIFGLGNPRRSDAPKFTWTATGSRWDLSVANCRIQGLRLLIDGANGVVNGINITGANNLLAGNYIELASGAALKATIGITVGSAALNTTIDGNEFRGTATHNVTDGIKVLGATVPSGLRVTNNDFIASATAGNGLIHITVAALDLLIRNNMIYNTHTNSTACIAVDDVAADGIVEYNRMAVMSAAGAPAAEGVVFAGGTPTIRCFENRCVTALQTTGIVSPANDA